MNDRELVKKHLDTLLEEAAQQEVPNDILGRLLLEAAVDLWRRDRSCEDISSELEFTAENLDPDQTFAFMRP